MRGFRGSRAAQQLQGHRGQNPNGNNGFKGYQGYVPSSPYPTQPAANLPDWMKTPETREKERLAAIEAKKQQAPLRLVVNNEKQAQKKTEHKVEHKVEKKKVVVAKKTASVKQVAPTHKKKTVATKSSQKLIKRKAA